MNRILTALGAISIVLLILVPASPSVDAADARPELVSGEVISLWNFMARGQHGDTDTAFSTRLVEKGLPIAILTDDGEIYIAVADGGDSIVRKMAPMMGTQVNAQGTVHRSHGINLIEIKMVAEAL